MTVAARGIPSSCALSLALLLASCAGSSGGSGGEGRGGAPTYSIGGTVSGLSGTGLVLQNIGGSNLPVQTNGAFSFSTANSAAYVVTVLAQPTNPSQTCTVTNGTGTAATANVTSISLSCATNTYTIAGTVSGLVGTGLVLRNNGGDDLAISANGAFSFSTPVASAAAYALTTLAQPTNPSQTCMITNGMGTVRTADIANVSVFCTTMGGAPAYPVKLSANGLYLTDQGNQPFFMNGDAAWSLVAQLSQADADTYLSDRADKGFNLVIVNLIEHQFATNAPANFAGQAPFTTAGDFNTPNEAYFAHADWVITKAAEKGIVVLLAPLYLGYACGNEGWCAEVQGSSLATMRSYGRYVGNRYKSFPNIIWVIGGDTDPVANGVAAQVREFVAGMQDFDPTHLFTAHNHRDQAAMDVWTKDSWLNINNIYTSGNEYQAALTQFNRAGAKPFFLIESIYEDGNGSTPLSLRRQAYWTVLSGGIVGHIFGNCPIWGFNAPSLSSFCANTPWQSQLNSTGSTTLAYVGRLFRSRAFYMLVPDQAHSVLTLGFESGDTYAAAARASDGSSMVAYIPTSRTVTIDLSQIAGISARAWWFNPSTAAATLINTYPTSGTRTFTPPDANDWVLVLDNASLNLPAPGI